MVHEQYDQKGKRWQRNRRHTKGTKVKTGVRFIIVAFACQKVNEREGEKLHLLNIWDSTIADI